MRAIEAHQTCINDIHLRLNSLETITKINTRKHTFHSKDHNGCWIVQCNQTKGSFSTALWRLNRIKKDTCPCCGVTIRRVEK